MVFQQKIKRSQFLHLALAVSASTLLLSACSDYVSVDSQSTASTTKASLTVATDPTYPPFESQAQAAGLEGFDIDIIKAIGKEVGLTIRFKSIPFDGMIPALQANTIDAAISAMTITPERQKTVSFSRPYFKAGLAIAVRNDTKIHSLHDLQGKKIAVEIGTVGAKQAKTIPGADISTYNSTVPILQEVANGNVDAFVDDAPNILYLIKTGSVKNVKVVNRLVTQEFYGIAVPQDSTKLAAINAALGKLIENGTYAKIYQKWFGEKPPQLPATAP